MFAGLGTLDFIARKENIIITAASGPGKCYLAQALGHQACMMEHKTIYANTARLLGRLLKANLLILDDFGLQGFDNHAREALMDIIAEQYNKTSTIISSQITVSAWYDIIGRAPLPMPSRTEL